MFSQAWRRFSDNLVTKLTPHQYFVTQGKGIERPFTGAYWWVKDVGAYHCVVCDQQLYPSHYKFYPPTGISAFWAAHSGAVQVAEDTHEIQCSCCSSHLGYLLSDGPLPTKQHHQVKSGALVFKEKPWFTLPPPRKVLRRLKTNKK